MKKSAVLAACLACVFALLLTGCGEKRAYERASALLEAGDYAEAWEAFAALGDYRDSAQLTEEAAKALSYGNALLLREEGSFGEAAAAFEALGEYRDSAEQAELCRKEELYVRATETLDGGDPREAIPILEELGDYRDSAQLLLSARYSLAVELIGQGRLEQASKLLQILGEYRDSAALLADAEAILAEQSAIGEAEEGSVIYFGSYEQNGDEEDGPELLAWYLLEKEEDRALLLCRDGIAMRPFHSRFVPASWANAELRAWLAGEFTQTAFSESDRLCILPAANDAWANPVYGTDAPATEDGVFLLSLEQAERYLGEDPALAAVSATPSALEGSLPEQRHGACWWLGSPGYSDSYAAYVDSGGTPVAEGLYCDSGSVLVRPAVWIRLSDEAESPTSLCPQPGEVSAQREREAPLDLRETPDMGQAYADRIVFIGDSTTFGYVEIGVPRAQIWAADSHTLNLSEQSFTLIVCGTDPQRHMTIRDAAALYQPEIIVLTLGVRQLDFMKEEWFRAEYLDLVKGLQEASPDTKLILHSLYPVAWFLDKNKLNVNNATVDAANRWIHEIAEETGARYLDSNSLLKDEAGNLNPYYSKPDGLHLNSRGLTLVLENIRKHAYD